MARSEHGRNSALPGLRFACILRLAFLWSFLLPALANAQFLVATNTDGSLTITGYTGPGGAVTIPDTINGLPVTSIGENAFYLNNSVTSFAIGSNVTTIADNAFRYCLGLTKITIPNNVTSIGPDAFLQCFNLSTATIGTGVTNLGSQVFCECNMTAVYFLGNAPAADLSMFIGGNVATCYYLPGTTGWDIFPQYTGITPVLLPYYYVSSNGSITITTYAGSGGVVTIPDAINGLPVTGIGDGAFMQSTNLAGVTVPGSVTTIGDKAFLGCANLTNTTIGNSVTNIGAQAFMQCISLANVTIPNSVTDIGAQAFMNCSSLTGIYFLGNAPGADSTAFSGDVNATAYYMPGTTGWVLEFAGLPTVPWPFPDFLYIYNDGTITITSYTGPGGAVTIPGTINGLPVTSIGAWTFYATSLSSAMIPDSITNVSDGAFFDC
jgi:hypothetical protein